MATADNAELLGLSGPRSPHPGKLGVIEEGALADLLLVDGDPIADLDLVADAGKNFVVIMKDGKVKKNTLSGTAAASPPSWSSWFQTRRRAAEDCRGPAEDLLSVGRGR